MVSTPRENKIETSQARDTATKKESAEPVQEKPDLEGLDSEKGIPVAEKSEKDGLKEDAAEVPAEKDSLKEETTEPAEAKEDGPKEEAGQAPAEEEVAQKKDGENSTSEEVKDSSEKADKEDKASKSDAQEAEELQAKKEAREVLEKGTVLNPQALQASESADGTEINYTEVTAGSFEELKQKLKDAKDTPTKIIITKSFEITETLTIEKDQNIILTSNDGKKMDGDWEKIKQPKDYADQGGEKQREVIEEARRRGKEAETKAEENIQKTGAADSSKWNYIFEDSDIVLKRAEHDEKGNQFTGTLFNVYGTLVLGDKNSSINFDGNKKEVTSNQKGSFFHVYDGGKLTLNNGVIANGKSKADYTGSVYLQKGAQFTMNGGRISSNEVESASREIPFTTGGVYVDGGSKFIFNNGMIDHNIGTSAALFVGNFSTQEKDNLFEHPESAAIAEMNGGYIIGNRTNGSLKYSGGVTVFSGGTFTLKDGIIADNSNYGGPNDGGAGAVYIGDGFIYKNSNAIRGEWSKTYSNYKDYVAKNKAEANFNGGLIYDNYSSWAAGGLFIDSEYVGLNRVMILDNRAIKWGGGIYYSFPPRVNKLEHLLVTENEVSAGAVSTQDEYWGGPSAGGGFWNCPTGYVHIGDGHSLYIYNNKASQKGTDISFAKRAEEFLLNGEDIHDDFYVHVSPITEKGNIIKFLNDDVENKKSFPGDMSYTDEVMYLRAIYSDELIKEAWSNSNAFILGNHASYGGGIGSNANLTTGDKGNVDFTFKKKWHEDIDKKEYEDRDLHIDIFIVPKNVDEVYVRSQYGYDNNLFKYGEVVLNQYNNWQVRFSEWNKNQNKNLPVAEDHGLPFTNEDLAKRGLKYLIIERETGYATNVEQKEKGSFTQYGKLTITKERSKDLPGYDKRDYGADFYFYELHPDGTATYIGKSKRMGDDKSINSEFVHPILNNEFKSAEYYGLNGEKHRYLIEKGGDWIDDAYQGYPENYSKYAIFIERVDGGIKFHVPYLWIQAWDNIGYSGLNLDHKEKGGPLVVEPYGYEFTVNNSPFTEAKIKKTWKMLTEEEIRQALGEYADEFEVKNREIPDSVTFYVLKNGKRIAVDYKRDENGKVYPIYKTVTLTKKGGWTGVIKELDPILLAKGAYGIEEEFLEGFKSSYEFKKILMNPEDFKDNNKKTLSKIQFKLDLLTGYYDEDGQYSAPTPLKGFMGDITVNFIVDGKLVETKIIEYDNDESEWSDGDGVRFGYDKDKQIIIDGKGHPIKVKYYNLMKNDIGYKNLSLDLYLRKDENDIYSLYVPNVLGEGTFIQIFDILDENDKIIRDFNPINQTEPIYEYIFEVTNEELPPEKPKEPPKNPPHEPPEEPEEPPVIPPEEPPVIPEQPPVTPKKPGGAPQTGVESVGSYILLAMTSTLGLGYMRRKKY